MKCPHCGKDFVVWGQPNGADMLIETYYRSRAAGSNVTLKQIAAQSAYSYSYLTKRKMYYDRAGKWGAKHKVKP